MELTAFHYFLGFIALFMLIYNTIEVGRNDAANIVNAVFGAKVLDAKRAILLAGLAVIVGELLPLLLSWRFARKGIFDPSSLGNLQSAINVYLAVYVTNTVLLYSFSAFWYACLNDCLSGLCAFGRGFAVGNGCDRLAEKLTGDSWDHLLYPGQRFSWLHGSATVSIFYPRRLPLRCFGSTAWGLDQWS